MASFYDKIQPMSLPRKVKVAFDETNILIIGSHFLLGFQFQSVFRPAFDKLPAHDHALSIAGLILITATIGLLIAPAMQHQIVEGHNDSDRIIKIVGDYANCALATFAITLGTGIFLAAERVFGTLGAVTAGMLFSMLAVVLLYGPKLLKRRLAAVRERAMSDQPSKTGTPLSVKIEHMLTQARVMIPGAQALLGFQLVIPFTEKFDSLPATFKIMHIGALAFLALTVVCLMAPAAIHRIVYQGEDNEEVHAIGNALILAASISLVLGISIEMHVVVATIARSAVVGGLAALACFALLVTLWHIAPLVLRYVRNSRGWNKPPSAGVPKRH